MKKILILITLMLLLSTFSFAQNNGRILNNAREKIKQLEKIKLIESLNMNEDTSIRFFARRNKFLTKIDSLNDEASIILDRLQLDFKSARVISSDEYQKKIDKYLSLQNQIVKTRNDFIHSLNDILSEEQIAKMLVFEKKFREDVKKILLKERFNRRN